MSTADARNRKSNVSRSASKQAVILCVITTFTLFGCQQESLSPESDLPRTNEVSRDRWYTQAQVEQGAEVFDRNCSACHGQKAEGLYPDWKQKLADGSFPPPPLNGDAHAWHHPLSVLLGVINQGGVPLGGTMPGFAGTLSDQEKLAAIAYFQNFWSAETYENWMQMGGTK